MRILGAFRDIMAAKMGLAVLDALTTQDQKIFLAVEGRAIELAQRTDLKVVARGSDELKPMGLAQNWLREELKPDAVVIGCSAPINWELELAMSARALQIPVVVCEDIWGALSRLQGFVPDLALTIDDWRLSSEKAKNYQVVGDIASQVDTSVPKSAKDAEVVFQNTVAGKVSIMIVPDHPDNVLEVVTLVAESLRLETNPSQFVCYYSLWHPKYADTTQFPQYAHVLPEVTRLTQGLFFVHRGVLSTDALTRMCDLTIGAFTTPLRTALHHGKRAISIAGPESLKLLRRETGFNEYPLVTAKVIPAIAKPQPISEVLRSHDADKARNWAVKAKFNPKAGAQAILELLKK